MSIKNFSDGGDEVLWRHLESFVLPKA